MLGTSSFARERLAAVLALLFLLFAPMALPARADDPVIPSFWQPGERLAQPDLAALPRLRFLTTGDFPPFNSLGPDGRLTGFNVDIARAVCAELGLAAKCEIQALPWPELQGALATGRGEAIIAGMAITAPSRGSYAFSRPYLRFPGRFVTLKTKNWGEPLSRALKDVPVGVAAGSAHEKFLRDNFVGLPVRTYPSLAPMLDDLAAGRIQAGFGDGMRLSFWLGAGKGAECCRFAGGPYLAPAYFGQGLAIATRPDDAALAAAFDYALHALSAKQTFAELYLRWFPVGFY